MDPDAFGNVVRGTAATCATASLAASIYGTVKGQTIGMMALASAIRGSITGATFFGLREFLVSPLLVTTLDTPQYVRRRLEIGGQSSGQQHPSHLSWSEIRMHKLLDSTISGALTGGILYSWQRGSARFLPGATTAGLTCAVLQLAYNEVHVRHVKAATREIEEARINQVHEFKSQEPPKPFGERFFEALGMPKITDEEYLHRLKVKREGYLRRIAELEAARDIERARVEKLSPKADSSQTP